MNKVEYLFFFFISDIYKCFVYLKNNTVLKSIKILIINNFTFLNS